VRREEWRGFGMHAILIGATGQAHGPGELPNGGMAVLGLPGRHRHDWPSWPRDAATGSGLGSTQFSLRGRLGPPAGAARVRSRISRRGTPPGRCARGRADARDRQARGGRGTNHGAPAKLVLSSQTNLQNQMNTEEFLYTTMTTNTAVPGPIAGAGFPALMALGGFMFARRRRTAATA
jgi:hypothetical protein